jgi:RNA polymerase sigma-70 factor, ECF subfamily
MTAEELEKFRLGDAELFRRLVAEHSPRLLGVALHLTRDRAAAHDLQHDTWVRAFETRAGFRGTGSFFGWMLALMRTTHMAQARTEARQGARAAAYLAARATTRDDTTTIVDVANADDRHVMLLDAVARLPERQRDVIVSRVMEERSVAETAQRLGIAEGTVKATLSQATLRLRQMIRGADDE